MPLPGGPANKLGNRYESWWTIRQLVRIIDKEADSIRIEDPNFDKAEFVVAVGDNRELHQAKRSRPEGKWNLSNLRSILEAMFEQLSTNENTRFVFVSGSDAPELRELAERAISAKDQEEFESMFVDAQTQKEVFERLKDIRKTDAATAYRLLHRIEVRTIDERELEDKVRELLQARFLSSPEVCDALRSFAEDSIHKCINRDDLISYLSGKGFSLRRLTRSSDAPSLIYEATDRYLDSIKRKLIQDSLIPRSSTKELLEKINGPTPRGSDCVVTGKAGGGKTGCVIECVEALRQSNDPIAVLAFRLDRIDPVSSTKELGKSLELEESPALVLEAAAKAISCEAVLIIDQLDAVSTTSGRSSDFFDVVEDLLDEVRGLRERVKLHVVVVCREFDWENDHRLRRLLAKDDAKISVTDFSLDEVKSSLRADGFNTALFDAKQLELLRLPQNLSLFLDANYSSDLQPDFFSEKDLFDLYWDEKREAVNRRTAFSSDNWANIIQALCDEITESQQLSVTKEKLDQFPNDYLIQMASEGVLSFDGKRYGFGHENFFDYCFARAFMTKEDSLVSFLIPSEQHLFRRAQVRQVLVYLRDADRGRYCRELSELLRDERIRYHLKDLAIVLAVLMSGPEENEWNVIASWIESELEAIKSGRPNIDKFASLVWNRFYFSQNWFQIVDRKDLITSWLASDNEDVIDMGVGYVRIHQEHAGDRVAELLEPFVKKNGKWPQRLSSVMQLATFENSRKLFDLLLKSIDNGTLNNSNWGTYRRLKVPPDWIAEVTAHWLQRRLSIVRSAKDSTGIPNWNDLFNHDDFGPELIRDSATKAPEEFVQHVLPVILKIADEAVYGENPAAPKRGAVWGYLINGDSVSISETCRDAAAIAVEKLAETRSDSIDKILAELRSRDTYLANFLLLRAYTVGAEHFANDAVSDLCDKTWRFQCGYSDNPYWIAMQLIEAATPLCSGENCTKLEKAILDYIPPWERTPEGYKRRGHACFNLLSSIPVELRSRNAQGRYMELERKFREPDSSPQELRAYTVGSPIEKADAEKMTNEQWLRAIQEYDSEERKHLWENPEKGGASELAQMLQEFVEQEPERFARLSLRFPLGTHPSYIEHILYGLKETGGFTELKLEVCRKAYNEYRDSCGIAITNLLGSIEELLSDDAVQMLDWLATKHSDPDKELWSKEATSGTPYYGGDILRHGINTTRGRAAWAIRDLIQRNRSYIEHFCSTIERLVNDNSVAVQACTSSTLLAILRHDSEFALGQFLRLVESRDSQPSNDRLLATPDVQRFIRYGLYEHFGDLQIVVEKMLRSNLPKTSESGARLVSIALLLQHDNAEDLVEEALRGNSPQRLGVAQVASGNIGVEACRQWSEKKLLLLFDDDDSEVRQEAAGCFRNLEEQSLESYENLIIRFCDSAAYQEDSFSLIYVLEKSPYRLPGITYFVCKKFLERFSEEANDMRTNRAGDVSSVSKLILRTYHQHQYDEWAAKCLDLIDQMCLEKSYAIRTDLNEYER